MVSFTTRREDYARMTTQSLSAMISVNADLTALIGYVLRLNSKVYLNEFRRSYSMVDSIQSIFARL